MALPSHVTLFKPPSPVLPNQNNRVAVGAVAMSYDSRCQHFLHKPFNFIFVVVRISIGPNIGDVRFFLKNHNMITYPFGGQVSGFSK